MQVDARRAAFVVGLEEPAGAKTPTVASLEARKPKLGARRAQIIADIFRERQKLVRHDRADRVATGVFRTSIAGPVAEKSGHGGGGAGLQGTTKNVERRVFFHINLGFLR